MDVAYHWLSGRRCPPGPRSLLTRCRLAFGPVSANPVDAILEGNCAVSASDKEGTGTLLGRIGGQ